MQRKRIAITLIAIVVIVVVIGGLMAIGPSLMNVIISMHSR
jgi:hypothetical protein